MRARWKFSLLIAVSILLSNKSPVFAVSNTFDCEWNNVASLCMVKQPTGCDYANGYFPNLTCGMISNLGSGFCDSNTGIACTYQPTPTPTPPSSCVFTFSSSNCTGGLNTVCSIPHITGISFDTYCCDSGASCTTQGGQVISSSPTPPGGSALIPYDPTCGPDRDGDGQPDDIKTALGCLPVNIELLFNPGAGKGNLMGWAIGAGAGLAFLLGAYGALLIIISAGNPEKMQAGRELITSAISGLLFIIFAVMLLQVIGTNILGLF